MSTVLKENIAFSENIPDHIFRIADDQQRYTNIKAYLYMMGTENRRVVKMVQTMERKVRNKYRRIVKNSVPVDSKLYDFVTVDISQLVRCQLC